jgi:hypothetical protein
MLRMISDARMPITILRCALTPAPPLMTGGFTMRQQLSSPFGAAAAVPCSVPGLA